MRAYVKKVYDINLRRKAPAFLGNDTLFRVSSAERKLPHSVTHAILLVAHVDRKLNECSCRRFSRVQ